MLDGGPPLWLGTSESAPLPAAIGAVVATSGSTSEPKHVMLSRQALRAAAQASRQWAGKDLTWHLALPAHYVAGLMVMVRAAMVGRPIKTVTPDLVNLEPSGDGDAISLVPTQLHRALKSPSITRILAAFDVVLIGGASLEPGLRAQALSHAIPITTTYGMSETCGGIILNGKPLPESQARIDPQGRIFLSGPTLFDGYLGQPRRTAEILRDGWLRTADRGRWIDGNLEVLGRFDDIIITGGIKVDLTDVRRAAANLAESDVVAVEDPEWGARIVVCSPEHDLTWWRDALAEQLPRTHLPRQHLKMLVPLTAGGKPDRSRLRALAWEQS